MAFTSGNDINILQSTDPLNVGAGAGNDRYVLDASVLTANQRVTITDTAGTNVLQLVGGLVIVSSQVAANALQLTLNNGAVITVLGADTFTFQTGGNSLNGTGGTIQNFADFATQSLGVAVPATGTATGSTVTVNNDGGTSVTPPAATYALAAGATSADEGTTATFTLTTTNVAAGTKVPYTLTGVQAADVVGGLLTGEATVDAAGKATITVALAADTLTEGAETLTVTLDGKAVTASTTVNDTSTTPVAVFALTASAASADEGTTVTLSIANGTPNTEYAIQISGVEDADITGAKVRVVTTDASGNASVNVAIVADRLTEGAQTLTAHIVGQPAVVASVVVNDTSLDNTAPAITAAADLAATEDTAANFAATAVDAEGDVVTLAATAANGTVVNNGDGTFSYTGNQDFNGADTITVTATDALGAASTKTIAVTVAAVNDAPVVTVPATLAADEETAANFAVSTSDVDGDTVTVTATAANGAVVKNADGSFTYTGSKDFVGADTITVTANDGTVDTVQTIAVTVANVNDAPVATAATVAAMEADTAVTGQLVATDVDAGDTLSYAVLAPVQGLTVNANGSYTFDATQNDVAKALKYSDAPAVITANYEVTDAGGLKSQSTLAITVTPTPLTFKIAANKTSAEEGATTTYTVTASEALTSAKDVTFTLVPGDGMAANTGTSNTNTADFATGAFNPKTVTIAAGATTATFDVVAVNDANTELQEDYSVKAEIADQPTRTLGGKVVDATGAGGVGQTFTLTKSVDTIPGLLGSANSAGTDGNDTIVGLIDATVGAVETTWTALDSINGGLGTNTFRINAITDVAAPAGATVTNVQNVEINAAAKVGAFTANGTGVLDLSTIFSGVSKLTVMAGSEADLKAGTTTAVDLSGVTGGVEIVGGASQTVSLANQGAAVKLSGTTGAVSVTSLKQDAAGETITIDGGSTVTVNTTSTATNDAIGIGAKTQATGAVSVTSNLNGDGTASIDQADITIKGGSTVTVNSNLTITAKDETASNAHTFGDVTVTGDSKTTSVTVNQTYAETEFTKAAVATVKELHNVTFKALTTSKTTTVDGLTFTASKDLTAAEVAQAFSNLTASDTQTNGGKVANGVFTGALSANFTSGAANGAVVVFTAKDEAEALALTAGEIDPTETITAGTAGTSAATSANTVTYGTVRVDDAATAAITTVSLNGYGSADLGVAGADLNALTTLSLANSKGNAGVATSAATLGLTVNNVNDAVALTAPSLKTLNVTATGADSTFGLTAAAVEALTVAGDKDLDITGSTLTALKTVTVTGSAGLSIDASGANVTSVDTTGTTGAVTASIDGSKATYTGGAGVDTVTLTNAAIAKNVSLGGGNDTLNALTNTVTAANLGGTFTFDGGDGTDTLVLSAAAAETLSSATIFEGKINSFERLSIGAAGSQEVVDLANLDDISYVTLAGSTPATAIAAQLNTITAAGTIEAGDVFTITLDGTKYSFTAASTSAADVAAGMRAVIAAAAPAGVNVGGTGAAVTLTSAVPGVPFTVTAATTEADGSAADAQTWTNVATTANNAGSADGITLNSFASNGTVVLTNSGAVTVNVKDATAGLTDVLNVLTSSNNNTAYGSLTANKVETINFTVDDTDNDTTGDSESLVLAADSVTKITVGNASDIVVGANGNQPDITKLNLVVTGASALATVDASAMLGRFTYTADDGTTTVTGGSGADVLTASGNSDVLIGGAGNDTLKGDNLTSLTGGAGNDTFLMNKPANVNSYSTIQDIAAGDVIDLDGLNNGTVVFTKSAVTLEGTAVFQDYANAAVNALGTDTNDAAWFQFGGNTYIVQSGGDHSVTTGVKDFQNGQDAIIKIIGLVDLSTASYNQSIGTLEIA